MVTVGNFERKISWLPVATLTNGSQVQLAIHEIRASTLGPTVGLVGSVHGDENISTAIVLAALDRLADELKAGRVLGLPIANPMAFEAITRNTPYDQLNLNRVFPGAREGLLTEQIAFVLSEAFIPQCDVIIDFHAAGHHGVVDYVIAGEDRELGLVFGRPHIYVGTSFGGTLTGFAKQRGARTLTPELGGVPMDDQSSLDGGVKGILNVLRHLQMIPGQAEYAKRQIVFKRKKVIKPMSGGVLVPIIRPSDIGREVVEGTLLATLHSPATGEVIEELRAPYGKNLVIHTRSVAAPIVPGMYAYQVADLDDAEVVTH
jgi:predicted deacylase